jgi:hypothetical protein
MADEKLELNEFQRRAIAIIESKWKGSHKCPICETESWIIGLLGATPRNAREDGGEGGLDFGSIFPTVPIVCDNCGYTLLFSAIAAGIVELPAGPSEAEASPPPQPPPVSDKPA